MADPADALIAELVEVGRDAARRGLVLASAGNLSARLPGEETFVVTAAGTWFDRLEPADFARLTFDGAVVSGNPTPSSEWKLHARTYEVRPDVQSVVHLHPLATVVLDACGLPLRLITLDHAFYLGSIGRVPYAPNGSDLLADSAAEASRTVNAVVLGHHGSSTMADTVAMAYRRALYLEEAARATLLAIQAGNIDATFPPEALAALHHH